MLAHRISLLLLILAGGCTSLHRLPGLDHAGALVAAAHGEMQVVDLTQPLDAEATVFSPELGYRFEINPGEGEQADRIKTGEHTGTHMDAALHFLVAGADMADSRPADLVRPAVILDVRAEAQADHNLAVDVARITRWEDEQGQKIPPGAMVILWTGRHESGYATNHDHPGFTIEAAAFLRDERDIAGVGTDALSPDIGNSLAFPVHLRLLQDECPILENLRGLDQMPATGAHVLMGPLLVDDATGSPARVLGLIGRDVDADYRVMELSHVLGKSTPTRPGRDPTFGGGNGSRQKARPVWRSGSFLPTRLLYSAGAFSLGARTGTHVTFPVQDREDGADAVTYDVSRLIAPLVVLDLDGEAPGHALTRLEVLWHLHETDLAGAIVLIRTRNWYSVGGRRRSRGYPGLSPEAATAILDRGARGILSQAATIDPSGVVGDPAERAVHMQGGMAGGFVKLPRRRVLPRTGAYLAVLPLAVGGADAVPARLVAVIRER